MAQPYKHPKSGIYHLRRKVPDALRGALGREYKRSLDTRDPSEAKARFAAARTDSERVFALARAHSAGEASYSMADAQQLAARWCRAELWPGARSACLAPWHGRRQHACARLGCVDIYRMHTTAATKQTNEAKRSASLS